MDDGPSSPDGRLRTSIGETDRKYYNSHIGLFPVGDVCTPDCVAATPSMATYPLPHHTAGSAGGCDARGYWRTTGPLAEIIQTKPYTIGRFNSAHAQRLASISG